MQRQGIHNFAQMLTCYHHSLIWLVFFLPPAINCLIFAHFNQTVLLNPPDTLAHYWAEGSFPDCPRCEEDGCRPEHNILDNVLHMSDLISHQVPAPALFVWAEQSHVTMTLSLSLLRSDTDDSDSSQRSLPYHFPGMSAMPEPYLPSTTIRRLRNRISM